MYITYFLEIVLCKYFNKQKIQTKKIKYLSNFVCVLDR